MVSDGPCLVPVADFHKDDVVLRIETDEWQTPQSLAPDVAGLQICFEKPGDAGEPCLRLQGTCASNLW